MLRDLLARPDLAQGIGASVECAEGLATMADLEEAGADMRLHNEYSRDTFVLVDEDPYRLLLTRGVA